MWCNNMATTNLEDRIVQLETNLAQRISDLEVEVLRLSQRVKGAPTQPETAWWKKIVGVYRDDPEFDEAMRLGREYRESLRPKDGVDAA
jgi:hypothetical protein